MPLYDYTDVVKANKPYPLWYGTQTPGNGEMQVRPLPRIDLH